MHDSEIAIRSRVLVSQTEISAHIYGFFLNLLGIAEEKPLQLRADFWGENAQVSQAENDSLALSFSMEEIDEAVGAMKIDTAAWPGWLAGRFLSPLLARA